MPKSLKVVFPPVAVFALMLIAPSLAQAQTSVSAGYQFADVSAGGSRETYPVGWYVDGAVGLLPRIALAGQLGGIYKSVDGISLHADEFMGGVRVAAGLPSLSAVTPFVQALVGEVSAGASGSSNSAFSVQLGGGLDIIGTSVFRFRVGADYRRSFFSAAHGGAENVFAGMLGVVIGSR
jgi:hypothetical protein